MVKKALIIIVLFSGCTTQQILDMRASVVQESIKSNKEQKAEERDGFKMEVSELQLQQYTGWWIYGEGQHIFKDEATLEEYDLVFPNENMEELVELYLAVCEMEYFPMECEMTGSSNGIILTVQEFEILYIQGCGE